VFRQQDNFRYFLERYRLYISPIAETYAYCLMPNHFHLVVRIRKREAIEELIRNKKNKSNNFSKVRTCNLNSSENLQSFDKVGSDRNFGKVISNSEIEKFLSKQFANLFSSYTQSFNKVYQRMGSLFIKNFKRNLIANKIQFLNAIIYTHRNPIHHGFRTNYDECEYSSYHEIIDGICDQVEFVKLIKVFGSLENFKEMHRQNLLNFISPDDLDIP
jgi:REP element-mobilizing transposase RayT